MTEPTDRDRETAAQILRGGYRQEALAGALAAERARGYERGRRDFQFEPSGDNHHNAALCPYCSATDTEEQR